MSHFCSKITNLRVDFYMLDSQESLSAWGSFSPPLPPGVAGWGAGPPCVTRAVRSCSADPLPPVSVRSPSCCPLTAVPCGSQTPAALPGSLLPVLSVLVLWLLLCLVTCPLLDTSSWRVVPPAGLLAPSDVIHASLSSAKATLGAVRQEPPVNPV